jgi:methyl-accepting chemotaxis protein
LIAGFSAVLVLMALVAGIGGYAVYSLRDSAYNATRVGARLNSVALEIQVHNLEAERRAKKYLLDDKGETQRKRDSYLEEARFEIHEIQSLGEKAVAIAQTQATRAKFQKIAASAAQYEQALAKVVESGKTGLASADAQTALAAYEDAAENLHEDAEDGEVVGKDASQSSLEAIDRTSTRAMSLVIGISILGLVLGIAVSYRLAQAILIPVDHLKDVAENVSLGNLDIAVKRYSEDEIGDLADSFSRMVTAVKFFRMEAELSQSEAPDERGAE